MVDFGILERFEFDFAPVGVKYSVFKPDYLPKLREKMAMCEMLVRAQSSENGFYTQVDNHSCGVGQYILGETDGDASMISGQLGPVLGVYDDPRANRQIYLDMPRLSPNTSPYVLFHTLKEFLLIQM